MSFVIRNRHRLHGTCLKKKTLFFFFSRLLNIYAYASSRTVYTSTPIPTHPDRPTISTPLDGLPSRQIYFVRVYFLLYIPRLSSSGYSLSYILCSCNALIRNIILCCIQWPPTGSVVNFIVGQVVGYRSSGLRQQLWSVRAYVDAIIIHCRLSVATAIAAATDCFYMMHTTGSVCTYIKYHNA